FGAPLTAIAHALGIEHAANDVIAYAGKVLDASAPDQHHRVLLKIMSLARDIARHLELIGKTDARDLAQRGVRLLRRRRVDARTDPPLLRVGLHGRYFVPLHRLAARLADELLYRRHSLPLTSIQRAKWPTSSRAELRVAPQASAPQHRGPWRASPQDHDPDMIPVSPAASNPRSKATRQGLPPAAKVRALYQADSCIVKGSGQKSAAEAGNQKSMSAL